MWSSRSCIYAQAASSRASLLVHNRLSLLPLRLRHRTKSHPHLGAHVTTTRRNSSHSHGKLKTPKRKSSTTISLELSDLPQGLLPCEPLSTLSQDEPSTYPTVVLQARNHMRKFENCVLLTRVGGFYELYFEHAEEFGPLLNLKVAQKRTNAGPVSMVQYKSPPSSVYSDARRLDSHSFSLIGS